MAAAPPAEEQALSRKVSQLLMMAMYASCCSLQHLQVLVSLTGTALQAAVVISDSAMRHCLQHRQWHPVALDSDHPRHWRLCCSTIVTQAVSIALPTCSNCSVASKSAALSGSACRSNSRVTTNAWCATTLNLLSRHTCVCERFATHSASLYGKKGFADLPPPLQHAHRGVHDCSAHEQ